VALVLAPILPNSRLYTGPCCPPDRQSISYKYLGIGFISGYSAIYNAPSPYRYYTWACDLSRIGNGYIFICNAPFRVGNVWYSTESPSRDTPWNQPIMEQCPLGLECQISLIYSWFIGTRAPLALVMKRKESVFWVAQALITIGVLGLVALPSTTSSPTLSTSSSSSQSSSSFGGLQLRITLNASSIKTNGTIAARIELMNTGDRNVSVSAPVWNQTVPMLNGTLGQLNAFDYVCSHNPSFFLVNFLLFRGHIASGNVSEAGTPLQEGPPVRPPCLPYADMGAPVTFLPHSDQAVSGPQQTGNFTAELNPSTLFCVPVVPGGGTDCAYGEGLVGYYVSSANPGDGNIINFTYGGFVYFPPGEYTIVAYDVWGQVGYSTFTVVAV
jgi:hypothetical protein